MKSTKGKCKIDGVAFGELNANLMGKSAELKARFALINSESGDRFGGGEAQHHFWSEETLKRFGDLITSMENDLLSLIFDGVDAPTNGPTDPISQNPDVPGF